MNPGRTALIPGHLPGISFSLSAPNASPYSKPSARILTEPQTDEFGTRYRAEDVEGHRWMFVER
jgi:hypothetical protein